MPATVLPAGLVTLVVLRWRLVALRWRLVVLRWRLVVLGCLVVLGRRWRRYGVPRGWLLALWLLGVRLLGVRRREVGACRVAGGRGKVAGWRVTPRGAAR